LIIIILVYCLLIEIRYLETTARNTVSKMKLNQATYLTALLAEAHVPERNSGWVLNKDDMSHVDG
jgi:hypothetical protein